MVWILFIALIAVAGGGAWQLYALQESLSNTRTELRAAQNKLYKVTGDVSAADANISQADSVFRSELEVLTSEVRKLWDVSNKRNREWINENKAQIAKGDKKLETVSGNADRANRLVDASKKNADKVQKKLSELDQLLKAVTTEQLVANSEMTSGLALLKTDFEQVRKLVSEQRQLQRQMEETYEQQIDLGKAFSSFRTQTNQRIEQLENSIRSLNNPEQSGLFVK